MSEKKIKKQNRINSKIATKSKFWCCCDRALVGQFGKCPICGKKSNKRKDLWPK